MDNVDEHFEFLQRFPRIRFSSFVLCSLPTTCELELVSSTLVVGT